jgi:hypothetical protein
MDTSRIRSLELLGESYSRKDKKDQIKIEDLENVGLRNESGT